MGAIIRPICQTFMADFFNLTSKKRKRLQKVFSWFTILSLVLQIGSGVVLARPAFGGGTLGWEETGSLFQEGVAGEEAEEGEILGGVAEELEEKGFIAQVTSALSGANRIVWGIGLLILAAAGYFFYRRRPS